jgi:hypothetical protein
MERDKHQIALFKINNAELTAKPLNIFKHSYTNMLFLILIISNYVQKFA